jgi:Lar family restriction alleviation protein
MDITMCYGKNCKKKEKCYRFTAIPDQMQSFADFNPKNCKDFIEVPNISDIERAVIAASKLGLGKAEVVHIPEELKQQMIREALESQKTPVLDAIYKLSYQKEKKIKNSAKKKKVSSKGDILKPGKAQKEFVDSLARDIANNISFEETVLAPCPFCGADDIVVTTREHGIVAECNYCQAMGSSAGNEEDAIMYWNNRFKF